MEGGGDRRDTREGRRSRPERRHCDSGRQDRQGGGIPLSAAAPLAVQALSVQQRSLCSALSFVGAAGIVSWESGQRSGIRAATAEPPWCLVCPLIAAAFCMASPFGADRQDAFEATDNPPVSRGKVRARSKKIIWIRRIIVTLLNHTWRLCVQGIVPLFWPVN